jgi:competence protein ComEC
MPFYDRKIRSIMITHPDADHITGILEVLRRYEIEEVYLTGVNHKNLVYDKILSEIKKQNIKTINPRAGNVYKYGEVKLKILYPTENYQNQEVTNTNNTSIVAKLSSGSVDYLFTGDITESKSKEILAQNSSLLPSEILKVPHHGSKDFSKEFIEKVNPEISIISVGKKNRYGHPSKEILEMLRKIRSKTYRTDEIGEVVIESNGKDFWKD